MSFFTIFLFRYEQASGRESTLELIISILNSFPEVNLLYSSSMSDHTTSIHLANDFFQFKVSQIL